MSDSAQDSPARVRWNGRYAGGAIDPFPAAAAEWLVEHETLLRELLATRQHGAARALDAACGDGRNARYLAELGFAVDAVDVSDVAIGALEAAAAERGLDVSPSVLDLEHDALAQGAYDVVVCMSYLQRDLFGALASALRDGGLLLLETFSRAHVEDLGRPLNPAYVLDRNELLQAFPQLYVRHYREGVAERGGDPRGVAGIVAQRLPADG